MTEPCTEVERLKGIETNVEWIKKHLEEQAAAAKIAAEAAGVAAQAAKLTEGKNSVYRKLTWVNIVAILGLAIKTLIFGGPHT